MNEERLRILKVMNEATGHLDFNEFANMVGLKPEDAIDALRVLAKTGHLRKVGGGYGLTDIGKRAIRVLTPVPDGMEFKFYFEIDQPTGDCAATPMEFLQITQRVAVSSLEFHMHRKDFENWAFHVLENSILAEKLKLAAEEELLGDALRSAVIGSIESAYNLP